MVEEKRQELKKLQNLARELEHEIREAEAKQHWEPTGFYGTYYATTGAMLGGCAALVSLFINVILAPLAGKSPIELIRIYLTFPLGEKAIAGAATEIGNSMLITFGCCLYVITGMLFGVVIYLVLVGFAQKGTFIKRLIIGSITALVIWLVNFYGILSWLQPLVCEGEPGNWITNQEYLPWWVAAGTHLVFGWTMVVLYPLGQFTIYKRPTTLDST